MTKLETHLEIIFITLFVTMKKKIVIGTIACFIFFVYLFKIVISIFI